MEYKIFGCRVNKFFLEKWIAYLEKKYNDNNFVIVSTCEVTDNAKKKWIREVIKLLKIGKKIFISGCGSLDNGKKMNEQKFYLLNPQLIQYKNSIVLLGQSPDESIKNLENEFNTDNISTKTIYTKKFIVIQNGCDTFCSFCLTISKRGKSQNYDQNQIIDSIKYFVDNGGKEIVLTGINIASYGCSNTRFFHETKFADLIEKILKNTNIERIRMSSLSPEFLNDKFFEIIEDTRILNHFHLSLQSFSDKILKLMNRNYTYKTIEDCMNKFFSMKRFDKSLFSFGVDLIVGFPSETSDDFDYTCGKITQFGLNKLHIFPFSGHLKGESVPAKNFKDKINQIEIKIREKKLIEIGDFIMQNFIIKNKGTKNSILIEQFKNGYFHGWTTNYLNIKLSGNYKKGQIVDIEI